MKMNRVKVQEAFEAANHTYKELHEELVSGSLEMHLLDALWKQVVALKNAAEKEE